MPYSDALNTENDRRQAGVRGMYKSIVTFAKRVSEKLVLCTALVTASYQASATSLIDFTATAYTTAATNLNDTGVAAANYVLPIVVGILALIVGVKLLKRFGNKI